MSTARILSQTQIHDDLSKGLEIQDQANKKLDQAHADYRLAVMMSMAIGAYLRENIKTTTWGKWIEIGILAMSIGMTLQFFANGRVTEAKNQLSSGTSMIKEATENLKKLTETQVGEAVENESRAPVIKPY